MLSTLFIFGIICWLASKVLERILNNKRASFNKTAASDDYFPK
jgi:hypothetical protein